MIPCMRACIQPSLATRKLNLLSYRARSAITDSAACMPLAQTQFFETSRQNPNTLRTATLREGSKTLYRYFGLKGCKYYAWRMGHKLLLRANALACMFSVAFTEGPHLCTSRETLYCVQLCGENTGLFREGTDHAPLVN